MCTGASAMLGMCPILAAGMIYPDAAGSLGQVVEMPDYQQLPLTLWNQEKYHPVL